MNGKRVAVIGAGLAGLVAARGLQRAGAEVRVLESADRVGGRVAADELEGCRVESAAQLIGSGHTHFQALVRALGQGERLIPVSGRDALWRGGRLHEVVYGSPASMAASGGLPVTTKLRLAGRYVPFLGRHREALDIHAPERGVAAGLDDESIADWGQREMDEPFVEALVYPQLAAYYGTLPEETSAAFYHLLASQGIDVSLAAISGGIGTIAEALAAEVRSAGGEVRTGIAVRGLRMAGAGVVLMYDEAEEAFDGVVPAIPGPAVGEMISEVDGTMAEWLAGVRFRPALSLALALDRPVGARYFGASFPRDSAQRVAAVTVQENKDAGLVPTGRGLLVAFATPRATAELLEHSSREVLDALLPDVLRVLPEVEGAIIRARVYRREYGNPVFYPGYLSRLLEFRSGRVEGRLPIALAGDYLYGASVEAAVISGEQAADRLQARLTAS